MGKDIEKSEEFRSFVGVCDYCNFSYKDILAIYAYLSYKLSDEQMKEVIADLIPYMVFRFQNSKLTISDVLAYIGFLKRVYCDNEFQYLPIREIAQYKGKSTDELFENEYYWIDVVYGYDESEYQVLNEKDDLKRYPSKDFIKSVPTKIRFDGLEDPSANSKGFEIGKEYNVKEIKGFYYLCDNDKTCDAFEVFPLEFKEKEDKKVTKLKFENALIAVRLAIEYGDVCRLYKIINDDTIYSSYNKDDVIKGRNQIIDFMLNHRKYVLEKKHIIICDIAKSLEDIPGCKKGDKFLILKYSNLDDGVDPVYIECDDNFITKIEIKYDFPAYKLVK